MIAKMQQLTLAARKADAKGIIAALQKAGVVHISPVSSDELESGALTGVEAEERKQYERLLARTETTLAELGGLHTASRLPHPNDWESTIESVAAPVGSLAARRTTLESDLSLAEQYGSVASALAELSQGLEQSSRLTVSAFTLSEKDSPSLLDALNRELQEAGQNHAIINVQQSGANRVGVVVAQAHAKEAVKAALSKSRVGEFRLPGRFEGMSYQAAASELASLKQSTPTALGEIRQGLNGLDREHGSTLQAIREALRDQVALYDVQAQTARGKYGLVLSGYVPESSKPDVEKALAPFWDTSVVEWKAADEHHAEHVPVKLENNASYVSNFEFLLNVSQPPRYGTFDPAWLVALAFPLFFGFIVADIGYGLMFLAMAAWMRSNAQQGKSITIGFMGLVLDPKTLSQVGFVITVMSIWSIIWGFLTGEFFGTLLEHLGVFYIPGHGHHGLIPIVFPRLESTFAPKVMILTILIGIVYLLWSWGLKAQLSLKHKHMSHFWEAVGMIGGLIGLVMLAYVSQAGQNFGALSNFANPLVLLMLAGFVVFIVGVVQSKVVLMFIEILSQGGNIISFTRLFAVGLASAILGGLATDLGWSIGTSQSGFVGFLFAILGVLVGAFVHLFALALTIIGHVMQPLRLHYVEYLVPTGFYSETGPRYKPFKRTSQ